MYKVNLLKGHRAGMEHTPSYLEKSQSVSILNHFFSLWWHPVFSYLHSYIRFLLLLSVYWHCLSVCLMDFLT